MKEVLISVIVPIYNSALYLPSTLDSILSQSLQNFELICVDNGSTDESPRILEQYARRDPRVRVLTLGPVGAGAARNAGIEAACGTFLCFSDSDDLYHPQALETLWRMAEQTQADITGCGLMMFYSSPGELNSPSELYRAVPNSIETDTYNPRNDYEKRLFELMPPWSPAKLFRRSLIENHHIRYLTCRRAEDVPFVYLALLHAEKASFTSWNGYYYRIRRDSLSHALSNEPFVFLDAMLYTYRRVSECGATPPMLRSLKRYIVSNCSSQSRLMSREDALECFRRIAATYEPQWHILPDLHGDAEAGPGYAYYRSMLCPDISLFIDMSNGWGHLEECELDLAPRLESAVELLLYTGQATGAVKERVQAFISSRYWLREVSDFSQAKAPVRCIISPKHSIARDKDIRHVIAENAADTRGLIPLRKGTLRILQWGALVRSGSYLGVAKNGRKALALLWEPGRVTLCLCGKRFILSDRAKG